MPIMKGLLFKNVCLYQKRCKNLPVYSGAHRFFPAGNQTPLPENPKNRSGGRLEKLIENTMFRLLIGRWFTAGKVSFNTASNLKRMQTTLH
jgi:hypothetical protein